MQLIDTHSHIYDTAFDQDRTEVVRRAKQAGIGHILLPAIDSQSHSAMLDLVQADPQLFRPMIGLHPTSVNDNPQYSNELSLVESFLKESTAGRFCAIGEIGIDLYWSRDWEREQTEVFVRQVELALEYGMPIVVHTRDAWKQVLAALAPYRTEGLRGVMHAFSGTYDDYRSVLELGNFMFGIGGVVTYKNSGIAALLPQMSLNHLVLETDSPYLTPMPHRGKRNESSYVALVCERVAQLLGTSPEEIAHATTENAKAIFGLIGIIGKKTEKVEWP